jgi:hypothetical protein
LARMVMPEREDRPGDAAGATQMSEMGSG